jgi:predicted metal-dependent phosphoesterase TrpH
MQSIPVYADLHNHTTFSADSTTSPKALVEALRTHPHVKAAAVTDHDTIEGLLEIQKLAAPHQDIIIIGGVEIATRQGDVLVLGAQELPPKPWDIEDIVDFARATDCVTIAAHPFRQFGLADEVADCGVDAIEVYNGMTSGSVNKKALDVAKKLGLPQVSGSDSHQPSDLFSVCTQVQASLNLDEILDAIRKGQVIALPPGKPVRS